MADEHRDRKGPDTGDTTEYSASKAPEIRREAEERQGAADARLIPGGARGARVEVGMSAMDRGDVPSEATNPGLSNYGTSPGGDDQGTR